jgi:hypothetical protein
MKTVFLLLLSCLIFFASCALKPESSVIGRWQRVSVGTTQIESGPILEFFQDGTFSERVKGSKHISWGNYKVLDSVRLKLEFDTENSNSQRFTFMATLSGDELTLSDPNDDDMKYRKLK